MIKIGNIYEGELRMNASGSAYLVSSELPKDIYINKKHVGKGLHLDTVDIEIIGGKGRELEGRVIEVVERFKTKFVGTLEVSDRFAFLIPDSPKMSTDIFIPLKKLNGGKDGQKVVVQMTNWSDKSKNPNGKVIEVLGQAGDNDVEIHSILHEYGLPYKFEDDVEDEANKIPLEISNEEISRRKDMRNVLTFTIDPDTAKDFDDALSVEWVGGNMQVGVHIADVSHYVRPETSLDKEAYKRGTSVYLVDRVVPMLPERLSNGVCSLRPHEDKLCFSAIFMLDHNGHVLDEWFGRTVIHSNHRFTYEEAQLIIEGEDYDDVFESLPKDCNSQIVNAIKDLDKTAKKMRAKRFKRGSISFDKREVKFKLDEYNKPIGISFKVSKDANKLIEEYMLLANRRVAQFLNKKGIAIPNRIHDEPDQSKLASLREYIKQFGYEIKTDTPEEITRTLNQLLIDVKGTPEENIVGNLVVRTMQKAEYSTENIGHYGLGFEDYAHFTSPIRRYPDVILHRVLNRVLEGKDSTKQSKLEPKCQYLSKREINAQKASRDSIKFKQCEYMVDKVGKIYKGVINGVTNYGVFVEMPETNCEGLVRLAEIGGDTFIADVDNYCVKGFNTGMIYRLGDEVSVVVKGVDIEKKNIDLTLIRL
jgi:ribonuclease R/exosome complex exonuclease DIS3/RRP44